MGRGVPAAEALPSTPTLKAALARLRAKHSLSQLIHTRVETIWLSIQGVSIGETARRVVCKRDTVNVNRRRWQNAYEELIVQSQLYERGTISQTQYDAFVQSVLHDLPRSGRKKTFTTAQEHQIVALASEQPSDHGIPINEWTHVMLAKVAIAKNIVKTISASQVGRILKKSALTSA